MIKNNSMDLMNLGSKICLGHASTALEIEILLPNWN